MSSDPDSGPRRSSRARASAWRRLLPILLLGAGVTATLPTARALDDKPTPAKARAELTRWSARKPEREAALKALADNTAVVGATRKQLDSLEAPVTAPVLSRTAALSRQLKARIDALTTTRDHRRDSLDALALLETQLTRRVELLETAKTATRGELEAATSFLGAVTGLAEEDAKPLLEAAKVKDLAGLAAQREALVGGLEELDRELAEARAELAGIPDRLARIKEQQVKAEAELARLSGLYDTALRRESYAKELAKREPSDLAGLLVAKELERGRLAERRAQQRARLQADAATVTSRLLALRALATPNPDELRSESRIPAVREAESRARLTAALLAHHKARVEILKALPKLLTGLRTEAEALGKLVEPAATLMDEIEVLSAVLGTHVLLGNIKAEKVGAPLDLDRLDKPRELLDRDRRRVASAVIFVKEREEDVTAGLASSSSAIQDLERRLPIEQATVATEKRLAGFVREVEKVPDSELVKRFGTLVDAIAGTTKLIETKATRVKEALGACADIETDIAALEDPVVRRVKESLPNLREQTLYELRRRAGVKEGGEPAPAPTPAGETGAKADDPNGAAGNSRLRELAEVEVFLDNRVRYTKTRAALEASLTEKLKAARQARDELVKALQAQLETRRRAYGCAEELQIRVGQKRLDRAQLPERLSEVANRSLLLEGEQRIEQARDELVALDARLAGRDGIAPRLEATATVFGRFEGLVSQMIKLLRDRDRVLEDASRELEAFTKYERKVLEDKARTAMKEETPVWLSSLNFLNSAERDELAVHLEELYLGLALQQRRQAMVAQAISKTRRVLELMDKQVELIEETKPALRELVERRRRRLRIVEAEIEAILDPSRAEAIAAELKKQFDATLELPEPGQAPKLTALADRLTEARLEARAYEALLEESEQRASRLGVKAANGAFEEDIGRYEARLREVDDAILKLRGHGRSKDAEPDAIEAAGGRKWYELGEIGVMRVQRQEAALLALEVTLLSLVLIPIAVVIVLALSKRFMRPIIERFQRRQSSKEDDDQDQRLETVLSVFQAAWRTFVMAVATIYLLKQLGFDITPIVASAGVVGLAVAFGAQSLVKDLFTGFFILLENQYKIGDYITIGSVEGYVEAISLRLTVLRDRQGNRHFMPNGEVTSVTNETQIFSGFNLDIGVSYDESPDRVIEVLREVTIAMYEDEQWHKNFHAKPMVLGLETFGDSSVNFRIHLRTRPGRHIDAARELRRRIKMAFDAQGIEIPFPQRTVHHIHSGDGPAGPETGPGSTAL